jgi:oxygen-dependent protoporphyrinogen oxidase
VGGGITGLAAARRLLELDPAIQVTLLESQSSLGGLLQTTQRDGFLIERSADNFITTAPWALELCRRMGYEDQLIGANPSHRQAKVVFRGRLEPLPLGFTLMAPTRLTPMIATPLLSTWGKLRLLAETLVPSAKRNEDESLASFARRRFGREVFERLIQPLIGGIYTADPERLSLAATLPRFLDLERRHRSLLIAAARGAALSEGQGSSHSSGARYGLFLAPREGMSHWIAALAAGLPADSVRLNSSVQRVEHIKGNSDRQAGWRITSTMSNGEIREEIFNAVIVCVPAEPAARLLANVDPVLSQLLGDIPYASSAIVSLAYRRDQVKSPLDSFGFVVPAIERRRILAASFSSVKYLGRAPDDMLLARVFVGGALQGEFVEFDDDALERLAHEELAALLKISGSPRLCDVRRWKQAMPQYHVGHLDLVARIEAQAAKLPGLALAGAAYRGVGIPHCVRSGESAADAIKKGLP